MKRAAMLLAPTVLAVAARNFPARFALVTFVLFVAGPEPRAHEQASRPRPEAHRLPPYVGVVTDGTATIFGPEFSRPFSMAWR